MNAILGISAFYHDSAAALVVDGEIIAAAQEERFTRKKHDPSFPRNAIASCLESAKLRPEQLKYIALYDKPLLKFERLLETYLSFAPSGIRSFSMAMPVWLREKLMMRRMIHNGLPGKTNAPILFMDHHESHAASAFFPSPFDEAAILTLDGVGEWSTTAWGIGRGNKIELKGHLQFPHSLGLLYSAFTYYCGFKVNSGEYKLMGLAPYGTPNYTNAIYKHLIDLKPDGSFWLNMDYFNYCQGLTMTNRRFHKLFGGPPRNPETDIEQRHMDLAASIQSVTEEIIMRMGRDLHEKTGMKHLVLAGGVALNCVANGRLLREGPYENIWIQPAAGDAGGALGAALFTWHQLLDNPRHTNGSDQQKGSFLGPEYSADEIKRFLDEVGAEYIRIDDEQRHADYVAELLNQEKMIGWFQGRMEFGPRALGARSIIGDARAATMQATMNLKIKFRESFRPFAPVVLQEHAHDWFDLEQGQESPYMLLVVPVGDRHRVPIPDQQLQKMSSAPDLRERVSIVRSTVPAITHVDYSARVQTVDRTRNARFHRLMQTFHKMTGCPVLVNTSFNVRGEPIVCTPGDAYRCFLGTEMDALVLENFIILKTQLQERAADEKTRAEYLANSSSIDDKSEIFPDMIFGQNNPFTPTDRMLRQFSVLWIFIVGAIAFRQKFYYHREVLTVALAMLALTIGPLGLVKPRLIKPIFVGLMAVTYPIGWIVSHVILAIIFYAMFTPLALVFRLTGRDPLLLRSQPETLSYWRSKKGLDKSQYLRQF